MRFLGKKAKSKSGNLDASEAPADEKLRVLGTEPSRLGEEAEEELKRIRRKAGRGKEMTPEEKREQEERDVLLKDMCNEIVDAEFTIPVVITGDPRWREYLAQEKLESLAMRWSIFFRAWGIQMAGPVSATIALALGHAAIFVGINRRIAKEDAALETENDGKDKTKPN
jgi:hypothetical protein